MNSDDRKVRELFSKLRLEDAASAPEFERLAAQPQRGLAAWTGLRAAIVSVAALFALTAVWLVTRPDPVSGPSLPEMTLSQWQSPTGFLMNFSGDSVLKGQPILDLPTPLAQESEKKEDNP